MKKEKKFQANFLPAVRLTHLLPPIYVVSITLPGSPVSLSSGDEVPHIFTRKSRLQPGEFLITGAKRLLQQYRHERAVPTWKLISPQFEVKLTRSECSQQLASLADYKA